MRKLFLILLLAACDNDGGPVAHPSIPRSAPVSWAAWA